MQGAPTDNVSFLMHLSLVSTQQVPPISHSTRSAKLFFKKVTAVVMIYIDLQRNIMRNRGVMYETNRATPHLHFCLKVVCKKGGVFLGPCGIIVVELLRVLHHSEAI